MTSFRIILAVGEFNGDVAFTIFKTVPIMWIIAMFIEPAIFGRITESLVAKYTQPTNSFNAIIVFRILFTVLGMTAATTLILDFVGNSFSTEIFSNLLKNRPRNFVIVLIAESLVIQPSARFTMVKSHESQEKKAQLGIHA